MQPSSRSFFSLPLLELVAAAGLWGFGFIATIWALQAWGPLWITVLRFGLACMLLLPWLYGYRLQWMGAEKKILLWSLIPGFFLGATLVLQTWGMQYTTATKSSFITCLYVSFVPILERVLWQTRVSLLHAGAVVVALGGSALIADLHSFQTINWGDFLTFLCSIAAAFHILSIGAFASRLPSPFLLNYMQSLWAFLLSLPVALFCEQFPLSQESIWSGKPAAGMLSLALGSTVIGFWLQIRAQRHVEASRASLVCLLESPFALVFAYVLLQEKLQWGQILGAVLILCGSVLAIVAPKVVPTS